jgi:hypothetical protein
MKMYAPAGVTSVSVRGVEMQSDDSGAMDIPDDAIQLFLGFGFTTEPIKPEPKKGKQT